VGKVHRYFDVAKKIPEERHFDVVVFDTSVVSFKLIDLFKKCGSKVIVIHHNYQYEYFRDNTSWWLKIPTLYWCKRYEGEAVRKACLNLTLTKQDISLLSKNYCGGDVSRFKVLGVFEYKDTIFSQIECASLRNEKFVITGDLGALQTRKSLIPWIKGYYPELKHFFPNSTLTIAGKNPNIEIVDLCKQYGINLVKSPISMDEIVRDADCYICPVFFGGGLKLRIMDGLKWGLPVLTHSVSARGYDMVVDKGFLFVYDDLIAFRNSLAMLEGIKVDKGCVRDTYCNFFSYRAGVKRISEILESF